MASKDLSFTTPQREMGKLTPFVLDGETLNAIEPKGAQMLAMMRGLDGDDEFAQVGIIDSFIDLCLTEDTAIRLRERMDDPEDPFDLDTLTEIISALRGCVDATPYWAVDRICAAAEANWEAIDGTSATHGVDPGDLPLGRFCNFTVVWLAERMSETQFHIFEMSLVAPPPEALDNPAVLEMTEAQEGQAFLAFAGEVTGGGG